MNLCELIAALTWSGLRVSKSHKLVLVQANELGERNFLNSLEELYFSNPIYQQVISTKCDSKELQWCQNKKLGIVSFLHKDYPDSLWELDYPPSVFHYLGKFNKQSQAIAMVGSRKPTEDIVSWCSSELTNYLISTEIIPISGGAIGIDQWVHKACLRIQKPNICILPSGMAELYPSNIADYVDSLAQQGGCVMSPFSPFSKVKNYHFVLRNEVIVGISRGVLILQAGRRSGTMLTAKFAIRQNKALGIVPGSAFNPAFAGSLDLIADGGHLIRDLGDLKIFESSLGGRFL